MGIAEAVGAVALYFPELQDLVPLRTEQQQLTAFVAVCWLVTLVAAAFSSVNERELRRRRADIEALARMATELELLDDPNAIASAALDRIAGAFAFDRAILIAGRAEGDLAVMAAHGRDGLDGLSELNEIQHEAIGDPTIRVAFVRDGVA